MTKTVKVTREAQAKALGQLLRAPERLKIRIYLTPGQKQALNGSAKPERAAS